MHCAEWLEKDDEHSIALNKVEESIVLPWRRQMIKDVWLPRDLGADRKEVNQVSQQLVFCILTDKIVQQPNTFSDFVHTDFGGEKS